MCFHKIKDVNDIFKHIGLSIIKFLKLWSHESNRIRFSYDFGRYYDLRSKQITDILMPSPFLQHCFNFKSSHEEHWLFCYTCRSLTSNRWIINLLQMLLLHQIIDYRLCSRSRPFSLICMSIHNKLQNLFWSLSDSYQSIQELPRSRLGFRLKIGCSLFMTRSFSISIFHCIGS